MRDEHFLFIKGDIKESEKISYKFGEDIFRKIITTEFIKNTITHTKTSSIIKNGQKAFI